MSYVNNPSPFTPYQPPLTPYAQSQIQGTPQLQQTAQQQFPGAFLTPQQQAQSAPAMAAAQTTANQSYLSGYPAGSVQNLGPTTKTAQQLDPQAFLTPQQATKAGTATPAQTKQVQQQQQQQVTDTSNQINSILGGLTYAQTAGPGATQVAQQLASLISNLPATQATKIMSDPRIKNNTTLSSLIGQYVATPPQSASAQSQSQKAAYDPLSVQTMWHDVFGPLYQSAAKIGANSGQDYISAMSDAIAGSNLPKAEAAHLTAQTKAMGSLMTQLSGMQGQAALTGPSFDTLLTGLSTAANRAALAQYEAEHAVAYGTANLFSPAAAGGGTSTTPGAATNPSQVNLSQLLSQTGTTP